MGGRVALNVVNVNRKMKGLEVFCKKAIKIREY